jgi:hypothetical protein
MPDTLIDCKVGSLGDHIPLSNVVVNHYPASALIPISIQIKGHSMIARPHDQAFG